MASQALLEQVSPIGNVCAVVEERANTIYFYLHYQEGTVPFDEDPERFSPIRACWVCNTVPVSDGVDMDAILTAMGQGNPFTMPGKHCRHAANGLQIDPELLEIVWFEEVDCAALLYDGEIMAAIHAWATPSTSYYAGLAKEFVGTPFLGMGALDDILPQLSQRVEHAKNFWALWDEESAWKDYREPRLELLEKQFGPHTHYFAIDRRAFPPRALVVFDKEDVLYFITVGMGILAQPRVELYVEDPENFRRVEIGMAVAKSVLAEISIEQIGSALSSIAAMPWRHFCWLAHGHSVSTGLFPGFNRELLVEGVLNSFELPEYADDPIKLLWLIPVTDEEFSYQQQFSLEQLLELIDVQNGLIYQPRSSVCQS